LRLAKNKEDITEEESSQIIWSLQPPQYGVLITYLNNATEIIDLCNKRYEFKNRTR